MKERAEFLTFDRVSLVRGGRAVFEGLSLSLSEARVGLVGNNGSGKSSFLRLVAGLLKPDAGRVLAFGTPVLDERPRAGFLFQNPDHQILFPTVGEEISFGLIEDGMDANEAAARAASLLSEHGCAGWEKRAVHELSDGQKQLACLLAVLAAEPDFILLDEPFSSLDLPTRLDLKERLRALKQNIIMASHDLDLLAEFDRVIWLENGRVRGDGPPKSVLAAYQSKARMGTDKAKSA